ncbi:hypothetical protein D0809_31100, partial [Flavobacterium circumlabens]
IFDTNYSFAKVIGEIIQEGNELTINVEIVGFRKRILLFGVMILLFYLLFFVGAISNDDAFPFFILPFLMIHMSVMLVIPYFVIRRSVNRMAYD